MSVNINAVPFQYNGTSTDTIIANAFTTQPLEVFSTQVAETVNDALNRINNGASTAGYTLAPYLAVFSPTTSYKSGDYVLYRADENSPYSVYRARVDIPASTEINIPWCARYWEEISGIGQVGHTGGRRKNLFDFTATYRLAQGSGLNGSGTMTLVDGVLTATYSNGSNGSRYLMLYTTTQASTAAGVDVDQGKNYVATIGPGTYTLSAHITNIPSIAGGNVQTNSNKLYMAIGLPLSEDSTSNRTLVNMTTTRGGAEYCVFTGDEPDTEGYVRFTATLDKPYMWGIQLEPPHSADHGMTIEDIQLEEGPYLTDYEANGQTAIDELARLSIQDINNQLNPNGLIDVTDLENAAMAAHGNQGIEELTTAPWSLGTISKGVNATSTTRVRTTYIDVRKYEAIKIELKNSNYKFVVDWYDEIPPTEEGETSYTNTIKSDYKDNATWMTKSVVYTNFQDAAAIRILIANKDDTTLSLSNLDTYLSAISFIGVRNNKYNHIFNSNNNLIERANIDNSKVKELYIGSFIQGSLSSGGGITTTTTTRISQDTRGIAFPGKYQYHININPGYKVSFRVGIDPTNLNFSTGWLTNGAVLTWSDEPTDKEEIPQYSRFYRITIAQNNENALLSPERIKDIDLHVWYEDDGYNIITGNSTAWNRGQNAIRAIDTGNYFKQNKFPIIAHTSDIHGDYVRTKNFFDFCDAFGVDAACVTGDIVGYHITNHCEWFHELIKTHKTIPAICTGNHDVYTSNSGTELTDSEIYTRLFEPIEDELGITTTITFNGQNLNTLCPTNYIRDLADQKLRIISYNLYAYNNTMNRSRWHTHYTSDFIDWLIKALSSTPTNYGIILLAHAPQLLIERDSDYGTFWQTTGRASGTPSHNEYVKDEDGNVASPLNDIIDAFIGRTSINKTYKQYTTIDDNEGTDLLVEHTFNGINSGVEFIACLSGHLHRDSIGYAPGYTHKQLQLNITCGTAIEGTTDGTNSYYAYANLSDQARTSNGFTQDAFNLYVIDRDNKQIKVIRVGSNSNFEGQAREYMEIPYAD